MSYYFSKIVSDSFDETVAKLSVKLKAEGFGNLTEIDVKERLKKKYNMDFGRYKILEACNPPFAYKALSAANKNSIMLFCSVIVQEIPDGQVKVSAFDPLTYIRAIETPKVKKIATEIGNKLRTVIDRA